MLGAKIHSVGARKCPNTGRARMIVAAMFAFSCAASFTAPPAFGCAFHALQEPQIDGMYPGSLSVAVALRRTADRGVIDATPLEVPRTDAGVAIDSVHGLKVFRKVLAADAGINNSAAPEALRAVAALYLRSVRSLQALRKVLAASSYAAELPARFSLGYVESRLWARYARTDSEIRVDIHTNGPAAGEAVMLTGEPAMAEILAGRISIDRALADGLVLIDGSESDRRAIHQALIVSSMGSIVGSR
jgi:hypothetical protein